MTTIHQTKQNNVYAGIFLVLLGITFLLDNFNYIHISWSNILNLWPILLIFWGLRYFSFNNTVRAVLNLALMLLFFILLFTQSRHTTSIFNPDFSFSFNTEEEDDTGNETYQTGTGEDYYLTENFNENIQTGKVNINLPAIGFHLSEPTEKLYELIGEDIPFGLKKKVTFHDKEVSIDIGPEKTDAKLSNRNSLELKLNPNVLWSLNIRTGASDLNLDLEPFRIQRLDIQSGASSIDVTLGDKSDKQFLVFHAGASDIRLNIPETAGTRITYHNILGSKHITGFINKEKNIYETPDFDKAAKKIYIRIESAIGNFSVSRY